MVTSRHRGVHEHPAVMAWRELDPHGSSPTSIVRLHATNLETVVYRLNRSRAAGGAVIAKRAPVERIAAEVVVYQHVLSRVPVPTPRFYGVQPLNGHEGWLFVEEAVGVEYDSADHAHRAAAARWLALFHAAASRLDVHDRLPSREPAYYLEHLRSARAAINPQLGTGQWTKDVDETLRTLVDRCNLFEMRWREVEEFFAAVPRTVVHGDFCLPNLLIQNLPGGVGLLPIDWEDAGWGVPAADLAHFPDGSTSYAARPDLSIYRSTMAEVWPHSNGNDIHMLAEFGTVFRAVSELWWESWRISYPYRSERERAWFTEFVDCARVYVTRMEEAAAVAGWTR
jgi:aminoglycoside phosphotransferase